MIRRRLRALWALAVARSRVVLGSLVTFAATVVPLAVDQIPALMQIVDSVPMSPGVRAGLQAALQVGGAVAALWGRVDDAVKRRNAAARIDP